MNAVMSYAILAYVAQTVSKALSSLLPFKSSRVNQLVREWLSTGTGVALAVATQMDILGDVGMELNMEPLGYILTGIIVGHGVQYTMAFLSNRPEPDKSAPAE